jgi:hypothetical protein
MRKSPTCAWQPPPGRDENTKQHRNIYTASASGGGGKESEGFTQLRRSEKEKWPPDILGGPTSLWQREPNTKIPTSITNNLADPKHPHLRSSKHHPEIVYNFKRIRK